MGQINHKARVAPGRAIGHAGGLKHRNLGARPQLHQTRSGRQPGKPGANNQHIGGVVLGQLGCWAGRRQQPVPPRRPGILGQFCNSDSGHQKS